MEISLKPIDEGEAEMMQFLNYEIKPCEEEDAEFFEEKMMRSQTRSLRLRKVRKKNMYS